MGDYLVMTYDGVIIEEILHQSARKLYLVWFDLGRIRIGVWIQSLRHVEIFCLDWLIEF